jgi:NAD(P)-dependent dehydrogenase (short-subunit alcohol dehydrogenase family)
MGDLENRVVLVTAAAGAIGTATALAFASEGGRIACADLSAEGAEATAAQVRAAGGDAFGIGADVLKSDGCERMVEAVVSRFGKLDTLVNLVGYFGPRGGSWGGDAFDLAAWNWMMDVNLKSVFMASKYAIPAMLEAGGGAIVNTGTIAAVIGRGPGAYGTSKSGVLALTRAMAADYAPHNIRVNCVCPSATDTPMYWDAGGGSRRKEEVASSVQGLSTPETIAAAFLYLASDRSPRVTGQILVVDGGFTTFRE